MSLEPNPEVSPHSSNNETVTSPLPDPESIIKENRMIVRIEYTHQHVLPQIYNEHTTRHQTYSVGWREYMVILRQQKLEFLKNRSSPAETVLFTSSTRFSIFSPLDITLSLTRRHENGMQIIIFRPQTRALAVEWYVTLRTLLPDAWPKFKPTSCEVLIPVLNDVRINIPLLSNCSAHGFTLDGIMETVLSELRGVNEWDDVLNELIKTENLKLGWKRYDRIEWISPDWSNQADLLSCPQFIEGTHQLQLRKSKHYPTQVTNPDGTKSDEPVSIEGYLTLFSTHKGKKKKIPKQLYFTSHDHYLFYMKPKDAISPTVQNQSSDLLFTFQPPHQHHQSADASNTAEFEQRFHQLKMTRGFYDLANVVEIKPVKSGEAFEAPSHQRVNEAIPSVEGELNNIFQIILNNGLGITLQAASPENMTKWIDRLNDLVRYWHLRLAADVQIRLRVMSENRNIDGDDDENISRGRFTINSYFNNGIRAFTDSTIWNWCVLEGCRSITLSGRLYHKSHYHGTFANYQHILTHGHLIYYKLHSRSTMGKSQPHTYNKRSGIISLRDCYVYSGSLTEHDLLYHHHNDPALVDKFPRVYADGMHCNDQEEECTFVIWKSVRRRVLGKNVDMIMFKKGLRFGSVGNVWVFKARSRIEKLEWVIALNREIQRVWDPDE